MISFLARFVERLFVILFNRPRKPRHKAGLPEGLFLLGASLPLAPGEPAGAEVTLDPFERGRPNYLVGSSGGGKTNTILRIVDWEIQNDRTVILIDLRGDAVERVLMRCAGASVPTSRLVLIDLASKEFVAPLNFLAQGEGEPYRRALPVLEFIKSRAEGWGVQLEEVLRCSLVALAEAGSSLLDIERLLYDSEFRTAILAKVSDPYTRDFWSRYQDLSADKQQAWALPCLNKLAPFLASPITRRMLGTRGSINLSSILNQPGQVVLISLAVDHHHEASVLVGNLLVGAIERAILGRIEQPEAKRVPVRLFIDEFENFHGAAFNSLICEGRRFGLGTTVSHQNQSQLDTETRHLIRNNAAVRLICTTGPIDAGELAAEVVTLPRDAARKALLGLQPGELVLIRTGRNPVKVTTPLSEDPIVSSTDLAAYKRAGLARFGQPILEIDAELAARSGWRTSRSQMPVKEVRNARLPKI